MGAYLCVGDGWLVLGNTRDEFLTIWDACLRLGDVHLRIEVACLCVSNLGCSWKQCLIT